VFAVVLGFVVGMGTELILLMAGIAPPRFFKLSCMAACVALCMGCRLVHERVVSRDYSKEAEARRKRMHW
jgi:hypothetical protein